ncbi:MULTISPECIES: GFA family protein [Sphingobium]|uniref:Aldehyde-activating protein n=1 Tax=Sphingobium fuliginis (strain ATCC 27551) TaxID=336203 RepID=A0ABQ1ESW3_SPHSA|nr:MULTISPECIES: aldehyde-activating protein [Sphingobium]OAP31887.1 aldehyde-activating protein [Sphingobium sp. 20006FA]AJR24473.1 aldehyde-activating protein [Sphingobium sp. YBL2]KXU32364.1 aldehyde-activating protein [Sphingobium sp. AM]KYC32257.1 aldehyde-activating protein [Sphingobium sp. 22B]RYL99591.1 aldehyde-activating protein [Sphingobium fuliginis]
MVRITCLCGRIGLTIEKRPAFINACNCTLCSKTGAHWAYLDPREVRVEGATQSYCREDKDDPAAEIQFCGRCGSTTHFTLSASAVSRFGNGMMGVNMRLADERDLAGIELRYPDGRSWSGTGDFGYVRAPRIIGQDASSG